MPIYNYNIISPATDTNKPYFNNKGLFVIPNIKKSYKYYIECSQYNSKKQDIEYFILLSNNKFNNGCRKCSIDNYCRLKLKLHGELLNFITTEMKSRGNINVEYLNTEDDYDVYIIE